MAARWKKWWITAAAGIALTIGVGEAVQAELTPAEEWALVEHWSYAAEAWSLREAALQQANENESGERAGTDTVAAAATFGSEAAELDASAIQLLQYQVNAGDTLYKISKAFGVTVEDLQALNTLDNPNRLKVGQMLEIPQLDAEWSEGSADRPVVQRVLSSTLTAYTAGKESTGKTPSHPAYGITRSGSKAEEGRTVAVDPSIIPLGSTVLIEGIGVRKAEDTGSAIKGARIDVFMNDLKEAVDFGVKKNVKVFVLADRSA
ncbi:3D domain-containing protein [Paenibacillus sp. GCM10012303]|uniref:3D domain-containing protein n=1 Tax=Paenibacillus sp. GCM10012303 TaxID=3317340 RepID=UPI00362093D6